MHDASKDETEETTVWNLFILNKTFLRWNLKNLSRGLNPPKPGLN